MKLKSYFKMVHCFGCFWWLTHCPCKAHTPSCWGLPANSSQHLPSPDCHLWPNGNQVNWVVICLFSSLLSSLPSDWLTQGSRDIENCLFALKSSHPWGPLSRLHAGRAPPLPSGSSSEHSLFISFSEKSPPQSPRRHCDVYKYYIKNTYTHSYLSSQVEIFGWAFQTCKNSAFLFLLLLSSWNFSPNIICTESILNYWTTVYLLSVTLSYRGRFHLDWRIVVRWVF